MSCPVPADDEDGGHTARRHKALIAGIAATVTAVLAGLVVTTIFAFAEARQRARAEDNVRRAEESRQEALREAYQARLAAAVAALGENDLAEARGQLKAAPAALRGWEWDHLRTRVEEESPSLIRPGEEYNDLWGIFEPGRSLVATTKESEVRLVDALSGAVLPQRPRGKLVGTSQTHNGPLLLLRIDRTLFLVGKAGEVARVPVPPGPVPDAGAISPGAARLALWWGRAELRDRAVILDVSAASAQGRSRAGVAARRGPAGGGRVWAGHCAGRAGHRPGAGHAATLGRRGEGCARGGRSGAGLFSRRRAAAVGRP